MRPGEPTRRSGFRPRGEPPGSTYTPAMRVRPEPVTETSVKPAASSRSASVAVLAKRSDTPAR